MSELSPSEYETLRDEVVGVITSGKKRAQRAVEMEMEKVRTYWEVGAVLHRRLEERDETFARQILLRLSEELRMAERLVYDLFQFYENFTRLHTYANLSWSHYRQTLSIPKAAHRRFYLQVASERQWTVRE